MAFVARLLMLGGMHVFTERIVLAVIATVIGAIFVSFIPKLDNTYKVGLVILLIGAAILIAHAFAKPTPAVDSGNSAQQKQNEPKGTPPPTAAAPSQTATATGEKALALAKAQIRPRMSTSRDYPRTIVRIFKN